MNKRKIILLATALCMIAILAVGGTLAYFTDTDDKTNVFTIGRVDIDQLEEQRQTNDKGEHTSSIETFEDNKVLFPAVIPGDGYSYDGTANVGNGNVMNVWDKTINNEIDKFVYVRNNTTYDTWVRTILFFEDVKTSSGWLTEKLHTLWNQGVDGDASSYDEVNTKLSAYATSGDHDVEWILNEDGSFAHVTIEDVNYTIAIVTYAEVLPGNKDGVVNYTRTSLNQLWLDPSADNSWGDAMGDTYEIKVLSQAVQAAGFDTCKLAMTTAFPIEGLETLQNWANSIN